MLHALRTDNSPFNEGQLRDLKHSIGALDSAQAQWLSGYLAGQISRDASPAQTAAKENPALTIIVGTETGNGEHIALDLQQALTTAGVSAQWQSLERFRPRDLLKLEHVAFIMSTHGEGDPPEEALELFEYLNSDRAPRLEQLRFRVLALGDRSYAHFCEAGRQLDARLEALGAQRSADRIECDVDYASQARQWRDELVGWADEHLTKTTAIEASPRLSLVPEAPRFTREHPLEATVEKVQAITAPGSDKDIFHLELSLAGSGLRYEPGDALGVWVPNQSQTVDELLSSLNIDPDLTIELNDQSLSIKQALTHELEITRLSADVIERYAELAASGPLSSDWATLDFEARKAFISARQLVDLVQEYPATLDAQALVDSLRPLASRSYSIASSAAFADDEIHLTVATLHSNAIGMPRTGVASFHLNHELKPGDPVRVFVESNRRFRLPDDPHTPVIMIGAGTGVAPFRAFAQQRDVSHSTSDAWLIFGNPHFRTDFLYQREWLEWRERGVVSRIDTAFSRDQAEKRYVQHVLEEQAERLERWLQRGAVIYLCGSLSMGESVLGALRDVIARQRGLDEQDADNELALLRRAKRIRKDLY